MFFIGFEATALCSKNEEQKLQSLFTESKNNVALMVTLRKLYLRKLKAEN